jgi:hypothetical protein
MEEAAMKLLEYMRAVTDVDGWMGRFVEWSTKTTLRSLVFTGILFALFLILVWLPDPPSTERSSLAGRIVITIMMGGIYLLFVRAMLITHYLLKRVREKPKK